MNAPRYEFCIGGQPKSKTPFHFKGSGLPNVYLINGFKVEQDPDLGETVAIERLEELFISLAFCLTMKKARLTGPEFRFLRKRMELTQADLARQFGVNEQTVANYEKGKTVETGPADIAVRLLLLAHLADDNDLAQELRLQAEELMKPSRRVKSVPLRVGPWEAGIC